MPGFSGKRILFGDLILPKTRPPVKLKVIAFGNCLASDPAITGQPLSGGSLTREESHVCRTVAARRGGVAVRRVACADGTSAAALAAPALHTAARFPEAVHALVGWHLSTAA